MLKPTINELYTTNNEKKIYDSILTVKAVAPINMNIMVPKKENGEYSILARVTWLCKELNNKLFCLTTTYVAENELDKEFFVSSPLLSDKQYISNNLTADILMGSLDHYITDMHFDIETNNVFCISNVSSFQIYCHAFNKSEDEEDKLYKITVTPEVFSTLTFTDEYMIDGILNNGDLYSALSFGANENSNTYVCDICTITILDIAILKSRGSSFKNLAVKMKLYPKVIPNKDNDIEPVELLALIKVDKSQKVTRKFIKKNKLKDLINGYMLYDNQYIQKFSFGCNINTCGHLFIRASNKNKDGVLYAFDENARNLLYTSINKFMTECI